MLIHHANVFVQQNLDQYLIENYFIDRVIFLIKRLLRFGFGLRAISRNIDARFCLDSRKDCVVCSTSSSSTGGRYRDGSTNASIGIPSNSTAF